jgi:hypothetical protein
MMWTQWISGILAAGLLVGAAAPTWAADGRNGSSRDRYEARRRDEARKHDQRGRESDRRDRRDRHDYGGHHDKKDKGGWGIDFSYGWHDGPRAPVYVDRPTKVWVEPVYRTVTERVWIEPVYRTVEKRIWIEPVVKTVYENVWVPDRFEWRETVSYDRFGRRVYGREYVLVEKGHWTKVAREVVVCEGRWETVCEQELIRPGRWEIVERQELVCEGHWEERIERVAVEHPREHAEVTIRVGGRW